MRGPLGRQVALQEESLVQCIGGRLNQHRVMVVQRVVKNAFVVEAQGGAQQPQLLHAFAGHRRDVQVRCRDDALQNLVWPGGWGSRNGFKFRCYGYGHRCLYWATHGFCGNSCNRFSRAVCKQIVRKHVQRLRIFFVTVGLGTA